VIIITNYPTTAGADPEIGFGEDPIQAIVPYPEINFNF